MHCRWNSQQLLSCLCICTGSGSSVPVTTELTCDAIKKCYKAAKKCFKTVKSVTKCFAVIPTLTPPLTVGTALPVIWVCGKAFYSVYK